MRHKLILISFVLFAVAGVLLAYPLVSTIINSKYHSDIETAYTAAIADTAVRRGDHYRGRGIRPSFGLCPAAHSGWCHVLC